MWYLIQNEWIDIKRSATLVSFNIFLIISCFCIEFILGKLDLDQVNTGKYQT